jgi:vancomycin resistance protein VanW
MWLQENKVHNLKLAVKKLDGLIIRPGERFSYWKTIGKTGKRQGYKKGMILFYGKVINDYGGGLCQLSNLLYWMFLHSALDVVERHRHSYDVFPDAKRTQPFGSGATCVYNYRDLQIENNTKANYQLKLCVDDGFLKGKLLADCKQEYSYLIYEKNHQIRHSYFGAYIRRNEICRKIFDKNEKEICDEYITENHALMMYQPFLEAKKTTTSTP